MIISMDSEIMTDLSRSIGSATVGMNSGLLQQFAQKFIGLGEKWDALELRFGELRTELMNVRTAWLSQTNTALKLKQEIEGKIATAQTELAASQQATTQLQKRLDCHATEIRQLRQRDNAYSTLLKRELSIRNTLLDACNEYRSKSSLDVDQLDETMESLEAISEAHAGGSEGSLVPYNTGTLAAPRAVLQTTPSDKEVNSNGSPAMGAETRTVGTNGQVDGALLNINEGERLSDASVKQGSTKSSADIESSTKRKRAVSDEENEGEPSSNSSQRRRIDSESLKVATQQWTAPKGSTVSKGEEDEGIPSDSQAQAWLNQLSPPYRSNPFSGVNNPRPTTGLQWVPDSLAARTTFGLPSGPALSKCAKLVAPQLDVASKDGEDEADLFPKEYSGSFITVHSPGMKQPVLRRWKHSMLKKSQ